MSTKEIATILEDLASYNKIIVLTDKGHGYALRDEPFGFHRLEEIELDTIVGNFHPSETGVNRQGVEFEVYYIEDLING